MNVLHTKASRSRLRSYTSLWLWARGRDVGIAPGGLVVKANNGSMVLPVAFAIATLVEMGVLHLLIPWLWLSIVLAVLSVWSLLAFLGHFAVDRVYPHYLTDSLFVVRRFGEVVAVIKRSEIRSVTLTRRLSETNATVVDNRLYLPNMDGANVDITLNQPISIALPALLARHRKRVDVDHISVHVDDPAALVTELRE